MEINGRNIVIFLLKVVDILILILMLYAIVMLVLTNYQSFNIISFSIYGSLTVASFLLFYYVRKIFNTMEIKPQAGPESLIGKTGRVVSDLNPVGEVNIEGIIWKAFMEDGSFCSKGENVIVTGFENLQLKVRKIN